MYFTSDSQLSRLVLFVPIPLKIRYLLSPDHSRIATYPEMEEWFNNQIVLLLAQLEERRES